MISGALLYKVMVMSYVYEEELIKQEVRDEIGKLERVDKFKVEKLLEFRDADWDTRQKRMIQSGGISALPDREVHYRYLNFQLLNALKESAYMFSL